MRFPITIGNLLDAEQGGLQREEQRARGQTRTQIYNGNRNESAGAVGSTVHPVSDL